MKNIFRKKKKVLSVSERFDEAKGLVTEALIMFQQADDAIKQANTDLEKVIESNNIEIQNLEEMLKTKKNFGANALAEVKRNEKLAKKITDFLE